MTPTMIVPATNLTREPSDLRRALAACRGSFLSTAFFSLFVNVLMLVPAIYMLAVYDRVLQSGSGHGYRESLFIDPLISPV